MSQVDRAPKTTPQETVKQVSSLWEAGTIKAGQIRGIPIRLHFSLLIVLPLALLLLKGDRNGPGLGAYLLGASLSLFYQATTQALVARHRGCRVRSIVWFPFRGTALIESTLTASDELWIALAGPIATLVGILTLYCSLVSIGASPSWHSLPPSGLPGLLTVWFWLNLCIFSLNILPALPVDGGRALRAFLSKSRGRAEATQTVAFTGTICTFVLVITTLITSNLLFAVAAVFLWLGTAREVQSEQVVNLLAGARVSDVMIREFQTLQGGDTLRRASERLMAGTQRDFPVLQADQVTGMLSRDRLLRALAERGNGVYVAEVMDRTPGQVQSNTALTEVLARLPATASPPLLVLEEEQLVGLLTTEGVQRYAALRRATRSSKQ